MIADITPRISLNCNGSLKTFSFSFPLIVSSDLSVKLLNTVTNVVTTLTETTHYVVKDPDGVEGVLADYSNGGTITMTVDPAYNSSDYTITMERNVPYTQAADFTEGMATLYANFEQGLDKATMQIQQLKDLMGRSPYCPAEDSTTLDMEMPNATDRANKYLKFDTNGEPTAVSVLPDSTTITTFGESLVNKADAAEARTVLDVYSMDEVDALAAAGGDEEMGTMENISFSVAVSSKNLTVTMTDKDGNALSASNKGRISFRSATLASGIFNTREIESGPTITLPSGATLGFTAALAGRFYVWVLDNGGTVELALSRTADIFPESNLVSTTAIGAGSDSATVMYSTDARTNLPCKLLGYVEITTGATAGEWDNAPSKVQVMGPGVHRTGDVVQVQYNSTSAYATGGHGAGMALDDSIPQNTEGGEFITQAIIPTSAINKLIIEHSGQYGSGTVDKYLTVALFQDATTNALAAVTAGAQAANSNYPLVLAHHMLAGTISSTTFKIRVGTNDGSGVACNAVGDGSGRSHGGVASTWLRITEVFA